MKKLINDSRNSKYRILDLTLVSSNTDLVNENLEDWEVTRMTPTEIEILMKYKDPTEISTDYEKDRLYIEINLT